MKKSLEEKLLNELIDRVIQKDRDIENRHEETTIKNANKEALIEMTDLSIDEINKIENDIRKEFSKKPKKLYLIFIVLVILLIVSGIFIYKSIESNRFKDKTLFDSNRYKNQLAFVENFDDNSTGWEILDDYIYRKYFEDGKYIFMTNQEGKSFEEKLDLKFPKIFTVEITSTWLGGDYDSYGVRFQTFLHKKVWQKMHLMPAGLT